MKATVAGSSTCATPKQVAELRGLTVAEVLGLERDTEDAPA